MSAKGRTKDTSVGEGREAHFTPAFPPLLLSEVLHLPGGDWLECMAGQGHLIRGFNLARTGGASEVKSDVRWTAVEKHAPCEEELKLVADEVVIADARVALSDYKAQGRRFRVGVTNPAFSLAFEATLGLLAICDWVVILQRTPWIGDHETRLAGFMENMPDEYRVGRVQFDRERSDNVPCSMFVWPPLERGRRFGRLCLLRRPTEAEKAVKFRRLAGAGRVVPKAVQQGLLLDAPAVQTTEETAACPLMSLPPTTPSTSDSGGNA